MRVLVSISFLALVACDSKSRNEAAHKVGRAIGSVTHEVSRGTEEVLKASIEETQKKRAEEMGPRETPEQRTERVLLELRAEQRARRAKEYQGFPGMMDKDDGFPGMKK